MKSALLVASIALFLLLAPPTFAHQPRMVDSTEITVLDPAVSKAYYGTLSGEPHVYTITATEPFDLYVGILIPYVTDSKKDVSAEVRLGEEVLTVLGGEEADWESMFEFFGQSTYWDGGEYKKEQAAAGVYTITVFSPQNDNKYSLAVGELEAFTLKETFSAATMVPELKRDFFNESPISFIKSPIGWGYILVMYILAFLFGFIYRWLLKTFAAGTVRGVRSNIGKYDKAIRYALWLGLLIWAITTTWSPWLLFFSGFALFEAIFSWCGLYAALGRNTCPR